MSKRNRSKQRMEAKAILPMFNYVSTPGKRASLAQMRGAYKAGRIAQMKAYTPAAITLPPISGPTLAEIEAKYGRI